MSTISTLEAPATYAISVGHITANITFTVDEDRTRTWTAQFMCGDVFLGRGEYYSSPSPDSLYQDGMELLAKELQVKSSCLQICKQDPSNQAWYPVGIEVPA